ncbi:MBL fold metallo-hydrolase [Nocardioides sp. YIM 152588]|uniref:MBL fold metallo-hydrolase n=1 Tax=Nocardioides sp. YIM 152588 TaxID=3158259 RepID=UPI0032E3A50A
MNSSADDAAPDPTTPRSRRRRIGRFLRRLALALLAGVLVLGGAGYLAKDRIVEAAIRKQVTAQPDPSFLKDDDHIRVLLCGTGSPELSAATQACTLVAAGGRTFLFDAGEGSTKSLFRSEVDIERIDDVFLTHFHSDHFNGLGTLVNERWTWGATTKLTVTGPPGVRGLVDGLASAYRVDNGYRAEDMPRLAETEDAAATAVGVPVRVPDGGSTRVYDEGGVTIDAVRVAHDPVDPAYGYVLTYAGKKVFVSGDTLVDPITLPAMQDADLVIHEAYATHLVDRAIPIMREEGEEFDAEVAERTSEYHADTIALAKQAQEAGVQHLVLTHLIPYPNNIVQRRMFVSGMGDEFDGEITLGEDGLLITV